MIVRLSSEMEERQQLIDSLVSSAEDAGRDLDQKDMELIAKARKRMGELADQLDPLKESARITAESRQRTAEIAKQVGAYRSTETRQPVEYRTAGAYIAEMYFAQLGDEDSRNRLEVFHRVAAHQTTADNPGLLPESIVQPVVNFVDESRPLVNSLGPVDLGSGSWSYARVTQHTSVAKQAGEKTELASRKMTITKTALGADTFGGYVNVSKQDINRSSPAIMDMIINDLAGQYAIETEEEAADVMWAGGTTGPILPTGVNTAAQIAAAVYTAAGSVFAATKGQGTTVIAMSPDMLGLIGPVFPPVNPQNGYGIGFSAAGIGTGDVGNIGGIRSIMSAALDAGQVLVYSTAAVKAFEYRYGALQVVEPSVWGVQVGYAGDFDCVVIEPTGVVKITKTP
jgi:HK97 family phage major capsid protein